MELGGGREDEQGERAGGQIIRSRELGMMIVSTRPESSMAATVEEDRAVVIPSWQRAGLSGESSCRRSAAGPESAWR